MRAAPIILLLQSEPERLCLLWNIVQVRVAEGRHHIAADTISRRYRAGLQNFLYLYKSRVDYWLLIDNSQTQPELIAEGRGNTPATAINLSKWQAIHQPASYEPDGN